MNYAKLQALIIHTLVMYYPFEYVGQAPKRFIVRASRYLP